MQIFCKNLGEYVDIAGGETLAHIYSRIAERIPFTPICARVNNKTEGMSYPVFKPKQVEFLPLTHPSSERVYVRSLCMMLYKAVHECLPGETLRIEHSISRGYYCRLLRGEEVHRPTEEEVARLKERMEAIVKEDIRFDYHEQLTAHVVDRFRKQGLEDKVRLLSTTHELYSVYYTLGDLADSYYGCLAPSTGALRVFDLVPYKDGMLMSAFDKANPDVPPQRVTQEKMYHAFSDYLRFNHIIGVGNVGELNQAVEKGMSAQLINVAEALHEKMIANISNEVTARYREGGARFVLVAGPSSSGKTTFTKRLAIQLMTNLLKPQMISLDDYFVDRQHTPRDADGDYDYESLYALDLKRFNADLEALLRGEEVALPTYNFATGEREYRGNTVRITPGTVLLIEGIHGLNPELTAAIEHKMKYTIYVSALTTLSIDDHNWVPTTDNRLLRRIIRDHKYRGTSAVDTLKRWPSVRRGEERWIFPYQENADSTFNSSLIFELGVMREYADAILRGVPADIPEYSEAYRLRRFLSYFTPISPEGIPSTSLLREFLGGSSFHY